MGLSFLDKSGLTDWSTLVVFAKENFTCAIRFRGTLIASGITNALPVIGFPSREVQSHAYQKEVRFILPIFAGS